MTLWGMAEDDRLLGGKIARVTPSPYGYLWEVRHAFDNTCATGGVAADLEAAKAAAEKAMMVP